MNKKLIIIVSSIIAFLFSVFSIIILFNKKKENKIIDEMCVSVLKPELQELNPPLETFGTVNYKTKNDITSLVAGNVIEKKVKEGDFVKKGQVLYVLKNIELEIQHSQYLNNIISGKANLDLYKAKLFEKQQAVKSQLISIQNKKLAIENAEKQLLSAKEKYETKLGLNKIGGVTNQAIKDMQDEIYSMETNLSIQKQELEMSLLGYSRDDLLSEGIIPSENEEEFFLQIIDFNTKTAAADYKVAEASYENAKKSLLLTENLISDLTIKSPVDGIAGATYFEKGEYVKQNERVVTVIDTSTCIASINIQENNIKNIDIGNRTTIVIPSLSKTIETTISEISPIADSSSGNFFVKADFINPELLVKPGMFLTCSIENNSKRKFLKIPETAVTNLTDREGICFSVNNNIAVKHNLKIAFIQDGNAYIENGLSENLVIINNPERKIKEGTHVKIL